MSRYEVHHKIDLLNDLLIICKKEEVLVPTKKVIDKHHELGNCVSYSRYVSAFSSMEDLIRRYMAHANIPKEAVFPPEELSLF